MNKIPIFAVVNCDSELVTTFEAEDREKFQEAVNTVFYEFFDGDASLMDGASVWRLTPINLSLKIDVTGLEDAY